MANQSITNTYAYDKAFPLVDYCGDIRAGRKAYSPYYSPNNIKRLLISPDRVVAYYHIPLSNGSKMMGFLLDANKYEKASSMPDYKPLLSVLYEERICSSIEEVIIFSRSQVDDIFLSYSELQFGGLIKNYQNIKKDLLETIKSRYPRLQYFTIADMTYNEFETLRKKEDATEGKHDFFTEYNFMRDAQIQRVNDKDGWYKKNGISMGSRTSYPLMDGKDGKLSKYFDELTRKMDAIAKKDAINKMKEERNGSLISEFTEKFTTYKNLLDCANRLITMEKEDRSILSEMTGDSLSVKPLRLKDCSQIDGKYINGYIDECSNETEALKYNCEVLGKQYKSVYLQILDTFLDKVLALAKSKPYTAKVLMTESDRALIVPIDSMISKNEEIERLTGYCFSCKQFNDSMANLCKMYSQFFISSNCNSFKKSMLTKDYWLEVIRKC